MVAVGESAGAAFGGFAEVAELAGAHHPFDRRAGLQVAGEGHRLGRVVPTEGMRQGVDQRIDGGRVGVGVVFDDPRPAPRVEHFGMQVGFDELADLDAAEVGGAYGDAVGSPGDAYVVGDESLFVVVPRQADVEVVGVLVGDDDAHRAGSDAPSRSSSIEELPTVPQAHVASAPPIEGVNWWGVVGGPT